MEVFTNLPEADNGMGCGNPGLLDPEKGRRSSSPRVMKYSATAATFALFVSESLGVLLTLAKNVKFLSYRLLKLNAFESRPKMVFGVLMLSLVAFDSESPKILPGVLIPRRTDVANTLDDSRAEPTTAGTTTKRKHLRASRVQDGAHIWFVCLVRSRYFQHGQKVGITQR